MSSLDQLQKLFGHIREHGVKRQVDHQLGGIWSADIWDLNGYMAQQADDGVTMCVGDDRGLIGFSEYGRPVQYWRGRTENDLAIMHKAFFPENA